MQGVGRHQTLWHLHQNWVGARQDGIKHLQLHHHLDPTPCAHNYVNHIWTECQSSLYAQRVCGQWSLEDGSPQHKKNQSGHLTRTGFLDLFCLPMLTRTKEVWKTKSHGKSWAKTSCTGGSAETGICFWGLFSENKDLKLGIPFFPSHGGEIPSQPRKARVSTKRFLCLQRVMPCHFLRSFRGSGFHFRPCLP